MENGGHQYGLGLTLGRMDERLGTIQRQLHSQHKTLNTIEQEITSVRSAIGAPEKGVTTTLAASLDKGDLKKHRAGDRPGDRRDYYDDRAVGGQSTARLAGGIFMSTLEQIKLILFGAVLVNVMIISARIVFGG